DAAEGSYAFIAFDTELPFGRGADTPILARRQRHAGLVLEWARQDSGVRARVRSGFEGTLEIEAYLPWDFDGGYSTDGAGLLGRSADGGLGFAVAAVAQNASLRALAAGSRQPAFRFAVTPASPLYLLPALPPH